MLLRLCQLKSLLLIALMLTGCSRFHSKDHPQELLSMLTPKWFLKNPAHTLHDQQGKPQIHLFFDNPPEFSSNQKVVNVIITTPENSPHAYELDLNSGQRFYSHSYCSQKDAWNQEGGTFERPPFSIGIVPHYLDQLGDPQKVIVFGGRNRIRHWLNSNYHPVKLFAAYVEQSCPEGNCLGKSNWLSRLVLLGSEMEDPLSKEVVDVASFQKRFEWSWIKANLENIDGRNGIGDQTYPAVRIGQMIEPVSYTHLRAH